MRHKLFLSLCFLFSFLFLTTLSVNARGIRYKQFNRTDVEDSLKVKTAWLTDDVVLDSTLDVAGKTTLGNVIIDSTIGVLDFTGATSATISASGCGKVTIAAGDTLSVAGTMEVAEYLYHTGDTDTNLRFEDDQLTVTVGNEAMITLTEDGTQDIVKLGDGGDVDINLNDDLFIQGSTGRVAIGLKSFTSLFYAYHATDNTVFKLESGDSEANICLQDDTGHIKLANIGNNFYLKTGDEVVAMAVLSTTHYVGFGNCNPSDLISGDSAVPRFHLTDTDINTVVNTSAQAADTTAIVLDASTTVPQILVMGPTGAAWRTTFDATTKSIHFDYKASKTASFVNRATIDTTGAYTDAYP